MAFRIYNPFPVFLDNAGQPARLGKLRFYESGTTDAKAVFSDAAGTQSLGAEVALDSAGRTVQDVFGSGRYRVRLYAAGSEVHIAEADDVEVGGGAGTAIPAVTEGYFLTNSGGVLVWAPVREVPDPTGQAGKQLGTDGANVFWEPKPAAPVIPPSGIVVTDKSFQAGTHFEQWGTATCPPSGSDHASIDIEFPEDFATLHGVHLQVTMATVNGTANVATGVTNASFNGFRAEFDIADRHFYQSFITSPVTFFWRAIGTKAAAAPAT